MQSINIQVPEEIVETIGIQEFEKLLKEMVNRVAIKIVARDLLKDANEIDLSKDPEWQKAREAAWEQEKANFYRKINHALNGVHS